MRLFFLIYLLTLGEAFSSTHWVVLPLPFYSDMTGTGLSVKGIYVSEQDNLNIDVLAFASHKKQYGLEVEVDHSPSFLNPLVWSLVLEKEALKTSYYGIGNQLSLTPLTTYRYHYDLYEPQIGYLKNNIRYFLSYYYGIDRITSTDGRFLGNRRLHLNGVTGGLKIDNIDSTLHPKKGYQFQYKFTYGKAVPNPKKTFQLHKLEWTYIHPISANYSHAFHFYYQSISRSLPFFRYPTIEVRGVEDERHREAITYSLHNEARIYFFDNWVFTPFIDIGKVMPTLKSDQTLYNQLHIGFGPGLNYILKEALIIRANWGFTPQRESSFIFSYDYFF